MHRKVRPLKNVLNFQFPLRLLKSHLTEEREVIGPNAICICIISDILKELVGRITVSGFINLIETHK